MEAESELVKDEKLEQSKDHPDTDILEELREVTRKRKEAQAVRNEAVAAVYRPLIWNVVGNGNISARSAAWFMMATFLRRFIMAVIILSDKIPLEIQVLLVLNL